MRGKGKGEREDKKGKENMIPAFKELLLIGKDINTRHIYYQYLNFKTEHETCRRAGELLNDNCHESAEESRKHNVFGTKKPGFVLWLQNFLDADLIEGI